ncbi:cyclic-phosphate processing receiver domain-containing protein [Bacillus sp. FJAT-51639]|uniref:Cyclic-phosphate processing receiver domain-containing protein n=1 Tax=Bacillus bruguierae TaxID=3127667 RepID=A0ABU8FD22_9BACI
MNVYMDDQRPCPAGFTLATTVEQALELIRNNKIHTLSLDYNMGFRQRNGLYFVDVFCKEQLYVEEIHFHTNDTIGQHYMLKRIQKGKESGEISSSIIIKCVGSY